jgi:hypothetical protein
MCLIQIHEKRMAKKGCVNQASLCRGNWLQFRRYAATCSIPLTKNGAHIGRILSFDCNAIFPDKTEGILCQKIPVHRMRPDPASSPAELPIGTPRTPAPEPGLFFPEPYEHGIGGIRPYPAEWLIPDIPYKKMFRTGKLAGVHIPV